MVFVADSDSTVGCCRSGVLLRSIQTIPMVAASARAESEAASGRNQCASTCDAVAGAWMRSRIRAATRVVMKSSGSKRSGRASSRSLSKNRSSLIASSVDVGELLPQLPAREREVRPHRSLAQFQYPCNLSVAEFFDEMHARHDALHLRERLERGIDPRRDLIRLRGEVGAVAPLPLFHLGQRFLAHAAAVLHDVEREVRDDAVDPRHERVAGPEAVDV